MNIDYTINYSITINDQYLTYKQVFFNQTLSGFPGGFCVSGDSWCCLGEGVEMQVQ